MQATLTDMTALVRAFRDERDWSQFHTARNLATALSVEASELLEPFQWLAGDAELPPESLPAVRHEMADVLAYLLLLADRLGVDLAAALQEKMRLNAEKYPADLVRGSSRKYDQY